MKLVSYFDFTNYESLNYNGFFIFTWMSLISSKLFWAGGLYIGLSLRRDLLGVFFGLGGSSVFTLDTGGVSSNYGYLIFGETSLRATFS